MYNRQRTAVDVRGNRVQITESHDSDFSVRHDGSTNKSSRPAFFDPDGRRLIPEGRGFFVSQWGIRYQLVD